MSRGELLPPIEALASSLLGFATLEVVYSTLLCLFVLVLAPCLRGRLPMLQYCLWALVLLRLVLPTELASPWSLRSLLAGSQVSVMEEALPIWQANHTTHTLNSLPDPHPTVSWRTAVVAAWLAGVLLFACGITRRLFVYRKLIRTARPVQDRKLVSRLRWWRASFKILRPGSAVHFGNIFASIHSGYATTGDLSAAGHPARGPADRCGFRHRTRDGAHQTMGRPLASLPERGPGPLLLSSRGLDCREPHERRTGESL